MITAVAGPVGSDVLSCEFSISLPIDKVRRIGTSHVPTFLAYLERRFDPAGQAHADEARMALKVHFQIPKTNLPKSDGWLGTDNELTQFMASHTVLESCNTGPNQNIPGFSVVWEVPVQIQDEAAGESNPVEWSADREFTIAEDSVILTCSALSKERLTVRQVPSLTDPDEGLHRVLIGLQTKECLAISGFILAQDGDNVFFGADFSTCSIDFALTTPLASGGLATFTVNSPLLPFPAARPVGTSQ